MGKWLLLLTMALVILPFGCGQQTQPPPEPPAAYSLPELKYLVLDSFDEVFWCDPDFYPVGRPGQEENNALEQFTLIRSDEAEFSAILQRLNLPGKDDYADEEKLLIYREHKRLTYQVEMTLSGATYQFSLRVKEGQGERIEGTVTASGSIKVSRREPSFNTCPICLTKGTLIDTPGGPVPVEQLHEGMTVWTADSAGNRVRGVVLKTAMVPAPSSFQVVKVTLSDGRTVTASPGHPTAEGRALGDYRNGDNLDGTPVVAVEHVSYDGATYDLLPSGGTGLYWANGILLKSTVVAE
ncbi:MAG: Hint domain-containing protein [Dehalococcoidales bacterium]|nr:Hint domain-containing protein [Dehalococcoidales bacterium]